MAEKLKNSTKKADGVHREVLKSLVSKCITISGDMDKHRGELGAAVKNAEDTHGVHRKAFKTCLSLSKMDDAARADYLRAFDDYREKLDLNPQPDMFAEAGGDEAARRAKVEADAADADGAAERNAKALKGGIKQLEQVAH